MMTVIFLSIALLLGYATTVILSMAATFAITSTSKNFVVKDFKIRRRYKLLQDLLWLPCAIAGGYVASWVGSGLSQWMTGGAFVAVLVGVLWLNAWEMRQRGVSHQIVMTLMSVAGVVIGFMIRVQSAAQ
jgi:hypothetical protein